HSSATTAHHGGDRCTLARGQRRTSQALTSQPAGGAGFSDDGIDTLIEIRRSIEVSGAGCVEDDRHHESPLQGGAAPLHSRQRGRKSPRCLGLIPRFTGGCRSPCSRSVATRDSIIEAETRRRTGLRPASRVICNYYPTTRLTIS